MLFTFVVRQKQQTEHQHVQLHFVITTLPVIKNSHSSCALIDYLLDLNWTLFNDEFIDFYNAKFIEKSLPLWHHKSHLISTAKLIKESLHNVIEMKILDYFSVIDTRLIWVPLREFLSKKNDVDRSCDYYPNFSIKCFINPGMR